MNRVSLSALGSVLFVMLLVAFSNLVISPRNPKVPGFALPTGAATAPAEAPKAAPEAPLPALLAKADPKKGEQDAKVCADLPQLQGGRRALKSGRTCGTSLAGRSLRSPASPIPTRSKA